MLTFAIGVAFALTDLKNTNNVLIVGFGMVGIVIVSMVISEAIKARLQKKLAIWHKSQLKKTQLKQR